MLKLNSIVLFSLLYFFSKAQPVSIPLNRISSLELELNFGFINSISYSNTKPLIIDRSIQDSLNTAKLKIENRQLSKNYFIRKLKHEDFIAVEDSNFTLDINPVLDLQTTRNKNENYITNMRGVYVNGTIGKNFGYNSAFFEVQSTFPKYISSFATDFEIVPGMGRHKPFGKSGFDYAMASGCGIFKIKTFWHIEFGHGKQFIGDGYRSSLLSDNSFNYPYLKNTFHFKKIQYAYCIASLQQILHGRINNYGILTEGVFLKKPFSFQYLTYKPNEKINLGFFQALIFSNNYLKQNPNTNFHLLNPVIYTTPLQYGLNNANVNALLGVTTKIKILQKGYTYAQLAVDNFELKNLTKRSISLQIGLKFLNPFQIKNLSFQAEYNYSDRNCYSVSDTLTSFTHYNQPLAQTLGNNFSEFIGFINWKFGKDLMLELKGNLINYNKDSSNTNQIYSINNPITSLTPSTTNILEFSKKLFLQELKLIYLINYRSNMSIWFSALRRSESISDINIGSIYINFGIRTNLYNLYHDF